MLPNTPPATYKDGDDDFPAPFIRSPSIVPNFTIDQSEVEIKGMTVIDTQLGCEIGLTGKGYSFWNEEGVHFSLLKQALMAGKNKDAPFASHDGYIYPNFRKEMRDPASITVRMTDDIISHVRRTGDVSYRDMVIMGWTNFQLEAFCKRSCFLAASTGLISPIKR